MDTVATVGLLSVTVAALGILATALFRLDGKIDAGIGRLDAKFDAGIGRLDARMGAGFARVDERLSVLELQLGHHLDTH
jgi:hypothetical protein